MALAVYRHLPRQAKTKAMMLMEEIRAPLPPSLMDNIIQRKKIELDNIKTAKWIINADDSILWNDSARILLVRTVGENPIVLNGKPRDTRKTTAWWKIFRQMVGYGMPEMPLKSFQRIWARILSRCDEALQRKRPLTAVDRAVQAMIQKVGAKTTAPAKNDKKKPLTVRKQVVQETRTITVNRQTGQIEAMERNVRMNDKTAMAASDQPRVMLHNVAVQMPQTRHGGDGNGTFEADQRPWEDLQYNRLRQKYEEERMEQDRTLFRQRLRLLELKICRVQLQLDTLKANRMDDYDI